MTSASPKPDSENVLVIRNWLIWDERPGSWLWIGVIGALIALTFQASGSWLLTGAAGLVLVLAFWRYWTPVRFEISPRGLEVRRLARRHRFAWFDFSRVDQHPDGLLLTRARLGQTTGLIKVFIRCHPDQQEARAIVRFISIARGKDADRPSSREFWTPDSVS